MDEVPIELSKEATMGWNTPWGIAPSHLNWLTTGDIIVLVLFILVVVILGVCLVFTFKKHDAYEAGFQDAIRSGLISRAKQRYNRDYDVIECLISEEEYRSVMDTYSSAYHTPKWVQHLKNTFNKKEGKECTDS